MSEIIDILMLQTADLPSFTVNNAVDKVSSTGSLVPIASNASLKNIFKKGDSFVLLSSGIIMPESFSLAKLSPNAATPQIIVLPIGNVSGHYFNNPAFQAGQSFLPYADYEMVSDNYCACKDTIDLTDPTKTLLDEDFKLSVYAASSFDVSMLGVPSSMNGKIFSIGLFVKILHTLPLS